MAGFYSQQTIQGMLDKMDKDRQRLDYRKPSEWEKAAPKKLNFEANTNPLFDVINQKILKGSQEATAVEMVKAQNRYNYKQYRDALAQKKNAKDNFVKYDPSIQGQNLEYDMPGVTGGYDTQTWGKDGIPEVSDIKRLNPNGPMRTMSYNGIRYTVNAQVAPIFQAFLVSLGKMGYKPASIHGYSKRNIAGTNTPSLHSYGFAIDIDPAKNPVTWNGQVITALPPGVGALAARYGLAWGGDWNGNKTDSMHFSVPYGGTK